MKSSLIQCLILISAIFINSCRNSTSKSDSVSDGTGFIMPEYAERFFFEKHDNYLRLIIKDPWQGAHDITQEYFLIKKGSELPDGIDLKKVIFIPIEKIVCLSTTHVAMLSALSLESTIVGVSVADYIYNETIRSTAASGKISDVGYEDNLNKELILKLSPDIVMVYGIGSESSGYLGKLSELGIKVIFNADYLETDPLGKAEWIKVIGSLYCMDSEADSVFRTVSEEYNNIKSLVAGRSVFKPTVLLGLPWKDTWFISPANSYISKLIEDAGGSYLWNDTQSDISMPYGLENVFIKAVNADFWLNIGNVNSRDEITSVDSRLDELKPFINGMLYNNNNRVNTSGGNDYWESGSIHPQTVLRDIASILHPELFEVSQLTYYKQIK